MAFPGLEVCTDENVTLLALQCSEKVVLNQRKPAPAGFFILLVPISDPVSTRGVDASRG